MKTISVKLKNNPYNIFVGSNLKTKIPQIIKKLKLGTTALIITCPKVLKLHKSFITQAFFDFNPKIITLADGETAKSSKYLFKIINSALAQQKLNQKLFIVGLGGGTINDISGFSAAIYRRGIPLIQIPTTLLASIDASIGGKTAIDLPAAKNILGVIYQPKAVIIDTNFLNTLNLADFTQGLAEAIKYAAIIDKDLFSFLENNRAAILNKNKKCLEKIIFTCAKIKAEIVQQDETETKGIRTILNFGHTLGHAVETALGYKKITHGQAVALGMIYAGDLSLNLSICQDKSQITRLKNLIKSYGLPGISRNIDLAKYYKKVYRAFLYDKKFIQGKIRMVLLKRIGQAIVLNNLDSSAIQQSLKQFFR